MTSTPRLDPESPIPLYHQIAEAIRYEIATGRLAPGTTLPPLREAAPRWGVNLHTVRHAYAALAESGFVTIRPPRGAVVAEPTRRPRREALDRFLERVLREARDAHSLSPEALASLIAKRTKGESLPTVHVLECSETQAEDLARQIEARWSVHAIPFCIDSGAPLPNGDLVATYFHYNDVRRLAPKRLGDVQFVTIRPDAALAAEVKRRCAGKRQRKIALVEREESMARSIAADVSVILEPLGIETYPLVVENGASALPSDDARGVVLFSPRLWGALPLAARRDRRALEVRYVIDSRELANLGVALGWNLRSARRHAASPSGETS